MRPTRASLTGAGLSCLGAIIRSSSARALTKNTTPTSVTTTRIASCQLRIKNPPMSDQHTTHTIRGKVAPGGSMNRRSCPSRAATSTGSDIHQTAATIVAPVPAMTSAQTSMSAANAFQKARATARASSSSNWRATNAPNTTSMINTVTPTPMILNPTQTSACRWSAANSTPVPNTINAAIGSTKARKGTSSLNCTASTVSEWADTSINVSVSSSGIAPLSSGASTAAWVFTTRIMSVSCTANVSVWPRNIVRCKSRIAAS